MASAGVLTGIRTRPSWLCGVRSWITVIMTNTSEAASQRMRVDGFIATPSSNDRLMDSYTLRDSQEIVGCTVFAAVPTVLAAYWGSVIDPICPTVPPPQPD